MQKHNKFLALILIASSSILLTGCPPRYEYIVTYYTQVKDSGIQTEKTSFGITIAMPHYENQRKRVYISGIVLNNDDKHETKFTFSDLSLTSVNDSYTLLRVDSFIMKHPYPSGHTLLNPGQRKPVVFIFEGSKTLTKKAFEHGLKGDTLTVSVKGKKGIAKMWAIGPGVK
jgi:hypothetical protein